LIKKFIVKEIIPNFMRQKTYREYNYVLNILYIKRMCRKQEII